MARHRPARRARSTAGPPARRRPGGHNRTARDHAHRDRHRLHPAPLLAAALGGGQAPVRHRAAVRPPVHLGDLAPARGAAARLRGRHPLRRGDRQGRALPARRRDGERVARRRALDPRHEPPRRALPPRHRAVARAHRPALRRPVLLLRQGRTLPGDRHRHPHRRQPGQHRAGARRRPGRGDAPAPLERRRLRRGGRHLRAGLARARTPARARPRRRPARGMSIERATHAGDDDALARTTDDDLRALLPAIEADRTLDDWGRSERIEGLIDRTVYEFFYRLWFRCEVEGVEHVPASGGALVVSNHAGALPPDAAMIAKAIKEEHPRGRPLHITVEHFFKGYPGFSMLLPKIGCVPAHPANVHRLLKDEQELVLVFPEGRKGTEKLYRDRYRLRRFGRGGFVEAAMRAGTPIVPVAVVGAEEAQPVFAHVKLLQKLTGLIYFPVTPTFPALGLAGITGYLPAKFRIRFLEPIPTDQFGPEPWLGRGFVQEVAEDVRARIQDDLIDQLAHRRSVWLG